MVTIIIEGVLFVALVATVGALLYWAVYTLTPVGSMRRQTQNRQRIERAAELTCPTHGLHAEHDLVRLSNGERVCPECYKEMFNGFDGERPHQRDA